MESIGKSMESIGKSFNKEYLKEQAKKMKRNKAISSYRIVSSDVGMPWELFVDRL